jgi:hypothetical protein
MSIIGKLWTDSVAYVALLAGAGLSIAGNVANVLRVRGHATDALDVVLAVAFPALVVLMVEVFVSSRWRGLSWPMQVLRWVGTVAIGGMAMRVSWVHLNELMLSRAQKVDVAVMAPLAIDALAIMATALILAGRGRPVVQAPVQDMAPYVVVDDLAKIGQEAGHRFSQAVTAAQPDADLFARLEREMVTQEPTLPVPISPAPGSMVKPENVPADAADLIMTWASADTHSRSTAGELDKLVAASMGRDARTARRWRTALLAKN